ncbi:MAG: DUF86 domain-containing protein [bacterium]|nr:DUF86 domain-containing protein [bacterium]
MNGRDRDLIEHILLAAKRLEEIADDGRDSFEASWMARAAAERQLEIIGEAAGKLSQALARQRPGLPLDKARAMRNFIAHDYDDIDRDLVWEAISASAPDLASSLSDLLDDTGKHRDQPGIEL